MEIFARLGGPPERFLPGLIGGDEHVPAAIERLNAFHRSNQHLIEVFADMTAALETLRARGVALAVWTGRDRDSGESLLRSLGLNNLFSTIVYGDDLPTHKPEPDGMREILRRLEVPADETIFVGDADVDVLGGVRAGVDTILIRHAREMDAVVCAQAWRAVETPQAAFEILLELTQ
jgi:HAD superfamily hydrolase (TIGR01509 family)